MTELTVEYTHPVMFTKYGDLLWTEREKQRLMNSYKKIPREKLMMLFPDRTYLALVSRAYILKIPRKGRWYSPEEDALLLQLYSEKELTCKQMAPLFMFRSVASLRTRMYNLGRKHAEVKKRQMEAEK